MLLGSLIAFGPLSRTALGASGDLDQARSLIEEAQPHVQQAMNPDNSASDRKKGRRAGYKLLKQARGLFDAHLDANPGEIDSLDSEYCALSANLYWIKKFATMNEFRGMDDDRPVELPSAESTGSGESSGSGIGGASRPDTPPPTRDDPPPKPQPDDPAPDDPRPDDPPPPADVAPLAPEPDPAFVLAQRARGVFEALRDEEARRPGDVAHLHALYEKFLYEFDDPTLPEYQKAALRLGALTDRMREVLKEQSGFDADDFDVKDSAEVTRVVKRLTDMLRKGDEGERQRASQMLGKLGASAGGFPLAKVLFDKDPIVAKNAAEGLVAIGGKRIAANLTKLYRDGSVEEQLAALSVLTRICQKGDVDARSVSHAIGRFVLSKEDYVSTAALDGLTKLGTPGVPGLMEALSTRSTEKRVGVIRALGTTGYVEATPKIAMYLLPGPTERATMQREAAVEAIEAFGMRAVPYLIPLLKDGKRKAEIRNVLTKLTGQRFSAARPGDWQKWWKKVGSKQVDDE